MNIWMLFCPSVRETALMRWWVFNDGSWPLANGSLSSCADDNQITSQSASAVSQWQILLQRLLGGKFPFLSGAMRCLVMFFRLGKCTEVVYIVPFTVDSLGRESHGVNDWVWICHLLAYFLQRFVAQFFHVLKWVEKIYQPHRGPNELTYKE